MSEFRPTPGSTSSDTASEASEVEVLATTVELGAVELGAVELGAVELGAVELGAVELGAVDPQLTMKIAPIDRRNLFQDIFRPPRSE